MRSTLDAVRTVVLAAATAASLGFGARQALAIPAQDGARACDVTSCTSYCRSVHGPDAIGRCSVTGVCRCLY